jgi:hypothetical protein
MSLALSSLHAVHDKAPDSRVLNSRIGVHTVHVCEAPLSGELDALIEALHILRRGETRRRARKRNGEQSRHRQSNRTHWYSSHLDRLKRFSNGEAFHFHGPVDFLIKIKFPPAHGLVNADVSASGSTAIETSSPTP